MSTLNHPQSRNHDLEDVAERHVYSRMEKAEGGGNKLLVKGTGTEDEEVIHRSIAGLGCNLPADTDAEVHCDAGGSDTNLKYGTVSTPHDKEHNWKERSNGLQNMLDPEKRVEFNDKRMHSTDPNFAVGLAGILEVIDGKVYIRGDVYVSGEVKATVVPKAPIPAFEP